MEISVVIPAYNEIKTIRDIIERVKNTDLVQEIVVVDDGSTDGTRELLKEFSDKGIITLVLHPKNMGKGAAVRSGIDAAKGEVGYHSRCRPGI